MADIDRTDAEGLLNEQEIGTILQDAVKSSAALRSFRTIRMGTKVARMPVLSALPTAGFVGESATEATGVKPTSEVTWTDLDITAEEIAVIIPVHENVFDDAEFDLWAEIRPLIAQEFARVLDSAVFFGVNKPATWPASIVLGARAAGNVYSTATAGDLAEDINQVWALVEADGFDVNAQYTARFMRALLRGLRSTDGHPIYLDSIRGDRSTPMIYGEDLFYISNGSWARATAGTPNTGADLIAGDSSAAILGVRNDMQFKILDQATVGGINLAERDMVAIRAKMRIGFQVAVPLSIEVPSAATRYPFAILDV